MPAVDIEILLLTVDNGSLKTILVPGLEGEIDRRLPFLAWDGTQTYDECVASLANTVAPSRNMDAVPLNYLPMPDPRRGLLTCFLLCAPVSAVAQSLREHSLVDTSALESLGIIYRDQLALALRTVLDGRTPFIPHMLDGAFTLSQLQSATEAVIGSPLDKRHFRRELFESDWLEETGEMSGGAHRPAKLYRLTSRHRRDQSLSGR